MSDFQHKIVPYSDLTYYRLKRMKLPLVIGPCVVSVYLAFSYLHPANNQWLYDGTFLWGNFIQFVLVDQIAIELVTYFILARVIAIYGNTLKSFRIPSRSGLMGYLMAFLPLFLVAFFVINPFTQTVRYLYHELPNWNHQLFIDEYFYSTKLYLTYLPPIIIGGYTLVAANLFYNIREMDFRKSKNQLKVNRLEVSDDGGKGYIDPRNILYIKRINRKATAFTQNGAFKVKHSLQELEELLFEYNFFRISRSVIVNLEYFKNYSFWENDKYVFRLHNGQEFVFSRDRLSDLRVKLKCSVTN